MGFKKGMTRTSAARKARKENHKSSGTRSFLPTHDPAPQALDAPPTLSKRESVAVKRIQIENRLRESKKRKRASSLTSETSRKRPRSDIALMRSAEPAILNLEQKWHAVALFMEERGLGEGHVSNAKASAIGKMFGVTGETLRNWTHLVEEGHSLLRNDGSGYFLIFFLSPFHFLLILDSPLLTEVSF